MAHLSIIERAFQLARDGGCHSIDDVRRKLKAEQFENVEGHLAGATIKRQLLTAIARGG